MYGCFAWDCDHLHQDVTLFHCVLHCIWETYSIYTVFVHPKGDDKMLMVNGRLFFTAVKRLILEYCVCCQAAVDWFVRQTSLCHVTVSNEFTLLLPQSCCRWLLYLLVHAFVWIHWVHFLSHYILSVSTVQMTLVCCCWWWTETDMLAVSQSLV